MDQIVQLVLNFAQIRPFNGSNFMENRGEKLNLTTLEEWLSKGKAPALDYSLKLFNEIKSKGLQIFLISSRREHLRSATIDNLVDVEYHGWTRLILRSVLIFFSGKIEYPFCSGLFLFLMSNRIKITLKSHYLK